MKVDLTLENIKMVRGHLFKLKQSTVQQSIKIMNIYRKKQKLEVLINIICHYAIIFSEIF